MVEINYDINNFSIKVMNDNNFVAYTYISKSE